LVIAATRLTNGNMNLAADISDTLVQIDDLDSCSETLFESGFELF
jgi:hypothetical protein